MDRITRLRKKFARTAQGPGRTCRYPRMTSVRARVASLFTTLMLAAAVLVALPASSSAAVPAAVPAALPAAVQASALSAAAPPAVAVDPAHPYSDPRWFPLRNPVTVSCAYSNCAGGYHGYYAIDFVGHLGDPIYPMGSGVFHIGAIDRSCPSTTATQGTWAWVDHGPAGVTRFSHLDSILATEGQLVTPTTEIATMGHNGNVSPCHPNYIHLEYRAERVGGTRLPIPAMRACTSSGLQVFPSALGYSSWNAFPHDQVITPAVTNDCVAANWATTPDRPTVTMSKTAAGQLLASVTARPAGTDNVRVRIEEYHPSIHRYTLPEYRDISPLQSGTHFSGLDIGYTYRFTASFHNAAGWSAWAPLVTSVASSPPTKPRIRSASAGSNWIVLSWDRASVAGGGTASYEVARRCLIHGAYVPWVYTLVGTAVSYKWYPVRRNTSCQVTVRGHNLLGWGPWSTRVSEHT
jgi:hypothetical protein